MTSSFELKFYEYKSEVLYDKNDRLVKKRKLDKSKIDSSFFTLRIQTESNDIECQLIEFIGIPFIPCSISLDSACKMRFWAGAQASS